MATRKAITTEGRRGAMGTPAFATLILVLGIAVIVGAFFIGKSDSGQINVAATIQTSNDVNGDNQVGVVPEAFRNLPNGGLVPVESTETAPPPTTPATEGEGATTTATTTDGEGATGEGEENTETTQTEEVIPEETTEDVEP